MSTVSPVQPPEPRLIRTARDAELVARDWLRYWGQVDAFHVGGSGDMGVDVESLDYVVQVKAMMASVGRPVVQQTYGVATHRGKRALVFSLGGFTDEAVEWAGEAGVGLFEFDLQGVPQPFNRAASLVSTTSRADGHLSRVRVEDGEEAIAWFQTHRDEITSARSNVLLVAGRQLVGEVVAALPSVFGSVRNIEADGFFPVETDDLVQALMQEGLLVVEEIDRLDESDLVEKLVRAVSEYRVGITLGSGSTKQNLVLDLPEFLLVGSTTEPGKISRRLLDVFDYWLIQ